MELIIVLLLMGIYLGTYLQPVRSPAPVKPDLDQDGIRLARPRPKRRN